MTAVEPGSRAAALERWREATRAALLAGASVQASASSFRRKLPPTYAPRPEIAGLNDAGNALCPDCVVLVIQGFGHCNRHPLHPA